jgi:membrane protein YdbS with pleckstrin-like domain
MAVVGAASLAGLLVTMLAEGMTGWVILLTVLWLVLVPLGAWHTYRWPARAYAFTSHRVDEHGIEIRHGVHWRVVINVPRSRVQHIDVSQGPVERRFGLGTLVIYTAGTDHAKVQVEGLEHGRALRIREHLLPSGAGDAV